MIDVGSITSAVSSLKMAGEIAKSLIELKSISEVQGKVIELQSQILIAQQSAFAAQCERTALIEQIKTLEEDLNKAKNWEDKKTRYLLHSPFSGVVVYALRSEFKDFEPPHWLCTQCFEHGIKSILNSRERKDKSTFWMLVCPECKFEIHTPHRSSSPLTYAEVTKADDIAR